MIGGCNISSPLLYFSNNAHVFYSQFLIGGWNISHSFWCLYLTEAVSSPSPHLNVWSLYHVKHDALGCKVTLVVGWGRLQQWTPNRRKGALRDDSCDEKGEVKGIFILYKRTYYVFQVVFVASIYKIRYTRGLRTMGRGSVAMRVCYPRWDELFLQKGNH